MYFSNITPKKALALLPLLLSLTSNTGATSTGIGYCDNDESGMESSPNDGITSDKSAGIGIEFETAGIQFSSVSGTCGADDTFQAKGEIVASRSGTNWELTADTLGGDDELSAEYIIDGTTVKIGSGDAAKAAAAIAADLTAWNPSSSMSPNSFDIGNNPCNPWMVVEPEESGDAADVLWAPQVTAAMPLEAISDLFAKNIANVANALLPKLNSQGKRGSKVSQQMISVTADYFQSGPNGITSTTVKDDVLGFFSLVLSYAKSARGEMEDQSPKMLTTIMPRTDFVTIFAQVKSSVPGTLYDIVKVLGCYKLDGGSLIIDTAYCSGTVSTPVVGDQMDKQTFVLESGGQFKSLTVSDWIKSIGAGSAPDALTTLDQFIDRSIGGLGSSLENMYGGKRAVPLFEFRNLQNSASKDFVSRVIGYEKAVMNLHKAHLNVPREIVKRTAAEFSHIKRTAAAVACQTLADEGVVTAPPTTTTKAPATTSTASVNAKSSPAAVSTSYSCSEDDTECVGVTVEVKTTLITSISSTLAKPSPTTTALLYSCTEDDTECWFLK